MGNTILSFEGNPNGIGKAKFLNGSVYTGEFKNGKRNGKGEIIYLNGTKYVGDYINMSKNGYGTMFYSDGKIMFAGMWKDGSPVYNKTPYKYNGYEYVYDSYDYGCDGDGD